MPGVYWLKSSSNSVLYVGKAKNLRYRLLSYLRPSNLNPKTRLLVKKTRSVTIKTTASELEALLLEAAHIKALTPPYNIRLKDDKSPLYIAITHEKFPKVLTIRKHQIVNSQSSILNWYGPFSSAYQAKRLLNTLRRVFPFCNQAKSKLGRACFYRHLNLCPGVCTGEISTSDYRLHLKGLKLLLSGKTRSLQKRLNQAMHQAASRQDFEAAIKFRNQLQLLNQLNHAKLALPDWHLPSTHPQLKNLLKTFRAFIPQLKQLQRIEGYDISNTSGQKATGSMVVFLKGQPHKPDYRHFRINTKSTPNDPAMLKEVLSRRFNHPEWGIPDLILIDGGQGQLSAGLSTVGSKIPLIALAKRQETIFTLRGQIKLPHDSPALHLLQAVRDEAHRFARSYHLKLRDKIVS